MSKSNRTVPEFGSEELVCKEIKMASIAYQIKAILAHLTENVPLLRGR